MKALQEIDAGVLVGLFVPLALYGVWWKLQRLLMVPEEPGWWMLDSLRPELLLHAAILCFWGSLLARFAHKPRLPRAGLALTYVALGAMEFLCHSHFTTTGSAMDGGLFVYALQNLDGMTAAFGDLGWLAVGVAALVLLAPLPWLLVRPDPRPAAARWGATLGLAGGLALLSLAPPINTTVPNSVSRHVPAHLMLSGLRHTPRPTPGPPWSNSTITRYPSTNLVIISLESVRYSSTDLSDANLGTTPTLSRLASTGLVSTHSYATMPHSTKAMVPMLCGVPPDPVLPIHESSKLPLDCLPKQLSERGYRTVHFRSATEHFENWRGLCDELGFEDFVPPEEMETEGFNEANYFGYEDDIMLEPARAWLEASDEPFFAFFLAGTPHHDYAVPARPGEERTWNAEDPLLDGYLRSIHYTDGFVARLMQILEDTGHADDTVVLILGDHGEGFGEHLPLQHNTNPYETGLRVPFVLLGPGVEPATVTEPTSHLDVVPTVLDAMGAEWTGNGQGQSLLRPLPKRTVFASCWYSARCLVSWSGRDKHIHHFGDRPDERFDVGIDPNERDRLPPDEAAVQELVHWYQTVRGRWQASKPGLGL